MNRGWRAVGSALCFVALAGCVLLEAAADESSASAGQNPRWRLQSRSRVPTETGRGEYRAVEKTLAWNPRNTAIGICGGWEDYWCPTIASTDFTGQPAFRFSEEGKPLVVFMISEPEYGTEVTLPAFARSQLEPRGLRCTMVLGDAEKPDTFPGLAALKTADLLVLSLRRRALPANQLQLVRAYLQAGKPLVAVRTACHAFHTRGNCPDGHAEWQEFDPEVLGGNYHGHHGNHEKTHLTVAGGGHDHPILRGVSVDGLVGHGSLYRVSPLAASAQPLLIGEIPNQPSEPVAWTNIFHGGRIFYTSLGHKDDFQSGNFQRLLVNAVFWALDRSPP